MYNVSSDVECEAWKFTKALGRTWTRTKTKRKSCVRHTADRISDHHRPGKRLREIKDNNRGMCDL